tara:strand:- start:10608 stop:10757 length:150 start_codon:yes stop_codon:yes gene_type:complete
MRAREAAAFENEYFYDKKGMLKVRKVLKGTAAPRPLQPSEDKKKKGGKK